MALQTFTLVPFVVPDAVLIQPPPGDRGSFNSLPSIPLSQLPIETLEQLCEQFRQSVLAKARGTPGTNALINAFHETLKK